MQLTSEIFYKTKNECDRNGKCKIKWNGHRKFEKQESSRCHYKTVLKEIHKEKQCNFFVNPKKH